MFKKNAAESKYSFFLKVTWEAKPQFTCRFVFAKACRSCSRRYSNTMAGQGAEAFA
jgi:hypothetical protein